MQRIKAIGLASVVALVFSAISVAAASAEEFIASTGKLKGDATSLQKFTIGAHFTVECEEDAIGGEVTETRSAELKVTEKYGACFAVGIGKATISEAKYSFFIPKLMTVTNKAITIKAEAFGIKCAASISIGQSVGNGAGEISYENKGGKLVIKDKLTKISTEITESNSESVCGKAGEKPEGTYTGNNEAEIESGAIEVATSESGKFEFSKTGGQLEGKATTTQVFKVGSSGTVECSEAKPNGEVTNEKGTEQALSVAYSGCSVSGLGAAEVSLADYTFFTSPDLLSLLNAVKIKVEILGMVKCEYSVLAGQSFTGIKYENDPSNANEILVRFGFVGIHTDILKSNSKSLCGTEGTESTTGEYEGDVLVGLSNGSIRYS